VRLIVSETKIPLALIVAQSLNRVIGVNNALPWHLPEDLKYFKATTMGKPIVMGRKTYDSIGRPLPGRTNIVVTRQTDWMADGVKVAGTLAEAVALASAEEPQEIMVIGGAQIYELMLPAADRIYLTQVHAEIEGDAWFPALPAAQWRQISSRQPEKPHDPAYEFLCFERVAATA